MFRIFFGFQIVLYGGCDGGSCKKNQKSQCFVHFLNVLMVREWIYVDVDRPRFQENFHTIGSTDHQVQLLNGFAIFHKAQHTQGLWKIAKKPNHIVKFGCGNDCVKLYFFQKMRFFSSKNRKKYKKNDKNIFPVQKVYISTQTFIYVLRKIFYEIEYNFEKLMSNFQSIFKKCVGLWWRWRWRWRWKLSHWKMLRKWNDVVPTYIEATKNSLGNISNEQVFTVDPYFGGMF